MNQDYLGAKINKPGIATDLLALLQTTTHRRKDMWTKVLVTTWVAWVVQTKEGEGRGLTWAEVMDTRPLVSQAAPSPSFTKRNDTNDFSDYDEDFFSNHDYVYVDTEDAGYRPPPVPQDEGITTQTAERRTLDFLFHTFMDHARSRAQGGRPVRGTTTRRPTLIEAVFKTIDDHIVQDLQEWTAYTTQYDSQAANTPPAQDDSQPAVIRQASPENDELLLVTDEQGQQQIVSINDIVTSLSHLDEQTLTNLLLSPDQGVASERSTRWALPPQPSPAVVRSTPAAVPIVLGIKKKNNENLLLPEQHKDPTEITSDAADDKYIVQDEHGVIQVVTLQDILASLTKLNSNSVNDLLFAETDRETPSSLVEPSPTLPSTTSSQNPSPPAVILTPTVTRENIVTHKGSIGLDPQGSLSNTDENSNIHIIPNSSNPVNLQGILPPRQGAQDTDTKHLPSDRDTQKSHRGQDILSTPTNTANQPTSDPPKVPQPTASYTEHYPAGVNSRHQIRRNPVRESNVQYILSPSSVHPVKQAAQPVAQTSIGGVGTILSSLLSRLTGQAAGQQLATLPQEPEHQQIKLVLQQQGQRTGDNVLSETTIPLPKPIHFQQTQASTHPTKKLEKPVQASSRDNNDPLPPILHTLSPAVQEALRRQINNVPKFIPQEAQRRTLSTATARMDTGPVERFDIKSAATTVTPKIPPVLLTTLSPKVLQKLQQQLGDSLRVAVPPSLTPTIDHTKPLDRSSYAELPYDHHHKDHQGHYAYEGYDAHGHTYNEERNPLFDIFLLADVTKVYKVGDTNLSVKAPKIGDSTQFVNTHPYYGHQHY